MYVLLFVNINCGVTDSVAAAMRPPRQARIRTTHRVQQAAAAKAREARHGGGTSFPPVDMLVYNDSDGEDADDEGHDDLAADESRSSTRDDTDADDCGNLRDP